MKIQVKIWYKPDSNDKLGTGHLEEYDVEKVMPHEGFLHMEVRALETISGLMTKGINLDQVRTFEIRKLAEASDGKIINVD